MIFDTQILLFHKNDIYFFNAIEFVCFILFVPNLVIWYDTTKQILLKHVKIKLQKSFFHLYIKTKRKFKAKLENKKSVNKI